MKYASFNLVCLLIVLGCSLSPKIDINSPLIRVEVKEILIDCSLTKVMYCNTLLASGAIGEESGLSIGDNRILRFWANKTDEKNTACLKFYYKSGAENETIEFQDKTIVKLGRPVVFTKVINDQYIFMVVLVVTESDLN